MLTISLQQATKPYETFGLGRRRSMSPSKPMDRVSRNKAPQKLVQIV